MSTIYAHILQGEGGIQAVGAVRVERRGKSSPAGMEVFSAVNSIRSNTVEGTDRPARPSPRRWLERAGNGTPRQMAVQDRTRLTDLLVNYTPRNVDHHFSIVRSADMRRMTPARGASWTRCEYIRTGSPHDMGADLQSAGAIPSNSISPSYNHRCQ